MSQTRSSQRLSSVDDGTHRGDTRPRGGDRPSRRRLLQGVGALALIGLPSWTQASTIDTLKVVIGAQAGGLYDLTGRSLGAAMIAAGHAQSAVYDNKGGLAGVSALLDFATDEHGNPSALMVVGSAMIGAIQQGEPLDALRRVTPIARLSSNPLTIVVPAGSPIRQMTDLVARWQSQPATVAWGGSRRGSLDHAMLGLLARAVRVSPARVNYVPLNTAADLAAALQRGHVQAGVGLADTLRPWVQQGSLRALAVTSPRADQGVPSLRQAGIDLDVEHWRGVFAPTGLDDPTRSRLIDAVREATGALSWQQAMRQHGWQAAPLFGDAFGRFVQEDRRRFEGVWQDLGIARPAAPPEALAAPSDPRSG